MTNYPNLAFGDETSDTAFNPLSAINVGIIDNEGVVVGVVTLDELLRTGNSQEIWFQNYAGFGEIDYEFLIHDSDNVISKAAFWRQQQATEGKIGEG